MKYHIKVFKHSYIPYTMNDVVDFERDFRRVKQGETLIYTTLHGLKEDLSAPRQEPEILENDAKEAEDVKKEPANPSSEEEESDEENSDEDSEEDEEDDDEDDEDEAGDDQSKSEIHFRPRDESPNSKKVP